MQQRAATYDKPEGERSMGATVEAFSRLSGVVLTEEEGLRFAAIAFSNGIDWQWRPKNFQNLSGKKYGRLTVVGASGNSKPGQASWVCVCECGNQRDVLATNLRSGRQRSCGCLRDESRLERAKASRKTMEQLRAAARERNKRYLLTEKAMITRKNYAQKNKDSILERVKKWNKENPESARSRVRNRRARLKNIDGMHTKQDIVMIGSEQAWMCAACDSNISGGYHADHVVPISRGGTNWPENIQLLCGPCNIKKSTKGLVEFLSEICPSLFKIKDHGNYYEA